MSYRRDGRFGGRLAFWKRQAVASGLMGWFEGESRRWLGHAAAILAIVGISRILAYLAVDTYAALFDIRGVDREDIARDTSYRIGGIAIVVALIHLTLT